MPVEIGLEIKSKGAIFSPGIGAGLLKAFNEGLDVVAKQGEALVKKQLYPGHGLVTGRLRESIAGDVVSDLKAVVDAGKHTEGRNVVYASWIEGSSSRNAGTRFKGYKMFERGAKMIEALPIAEIIGAKILRFLK